MFQKATKAKLKARVALIGPPGSGKSYTSLKMAAAMGSKIAVIDTEKGSARKYSDVASFDVCELHDFAPRAYLDAMRFAKDGGYDVLVIDSLSHAWEGEGGILEQVDARGGRFDAWKEMGPQLRHMIDAILEYPGHVLITLRAKTEWAVEQIERNGRTQNVPKKIGLAPRFKEGLEYEFDVVGLMDSDNTLTITKARIAGMNGEMIKHPGADFAMRIRAWLEDGVDEEARVRGLLTAAATPADLELAGKELARARKQKLLDDDATVRLQAIGREMRAKISEGVSENV